jgi:thioredoxin reductase (NADPH)
MLLLLIDRFKCYFDVCLFKMGRYDVAIIGTGVAGYGAAIYAARFNLKTLLIGKRFGGLIQDTHVVENYPGIKSVTGSELANQIKEHVADYAVDMKEEEITSITKVGKIFKIKGKKTFEAKSLIFATGTIRRKLEVAGSLELENRGVSYCATCDGPLFRNKIISVYGGSDSAAKEALLLSQFVKKAYIIYRGDKIRAEPINLDRVIKNKKIEIITNTNITSVNGKDFLESLSLDKKYKGKDTLAMDGLFVEIGSLPQNSLAKSLGVKLNKKGEIKIGLGSETNVPGVYAAGDVTDRSFKQAITGVSEGVTAAFSAYKDLQN